MNRSFSKLLGALVASTLFLAMGTASAAPATPTAPAARPPVPAPPAGPPMEVDVNLILDVDVSASIDPQEAELQRRGTVEAFLSKEVIQAIQAGSLGRIGVAVVYFSSRAYGYLSVPVNWMIVNDQKSASDFVKTLVAAPRRSAIGTSIADAFELSQRLFETSPYHASKEIIDVSGDGPNNAGRPVLDSRSEVLQRGVTINGLPIINASTMQDLDKYYEGCVVGGPGAFVITAKGFEDFARAVRRKLVLEISGLTPKDTPETPRIVRVAAAGQNAAPARPNFRPLQPKVNPPYPGGCDFPLFGGYGFR
ncbi:MAG TPA: DUF1194 domain-containing protein [Micropepsaceae bacterium]|nr:DUF1194 domain-containing protein [Micropepsaceae bacterium]